MIVWWLLSLFYLFCQNPISMVLALLSGILLFVAVKLPQEKQDKRRNKRRNEFKVYNDQNIK